MKANHMVGPADTAGPADTIVTDCRYNPELGGFAGIRVETPEYTALLPPYRTGITLEFLQQLARAVNKAAAKLPVKDEMEK
jgi:hypothetical protein